MTKVYRQDFWYNGEIAEFGSPRNDVFFRETDALQKVRTFFGLPEDRKLLLYAPTFRDDGSTDCYNLDPEAVLRACESRFGGRWSALLRLHPNAARLSAGLFPYNSDTILDATAYPDMQELLLAADVLLTDYSSCMWDFSLMLRPCFLYARDIAAYQGERDFYTPIESWPFPLAADNDGLEQVITDFDEEKYRADALRHHQELGSAESGTATAQCAARIAAFLNK
jgi:CDP-glycerol glycerophosphotransferase